MKYDPEMTTNAMLKLLGLGTAPSRFSRKWIVNAGGAPLPLQPMNCFECNDWLKLMLDD